MSPADKSGILAEIGFRLKGQKLVDWTIGLIGLIGLVEVIAEVISGGRRLGCAI